MVSFVLWLAVLIEGKAPEILHDFVAGYVRYATHVGAYLYLAAPVSRASAVAAGIRSTSRSTRPSGRTGGRPSSGSCLPSRRCSSRRCSEADSPLGSPGRLGGIGERRGVRSAAWTGASVTGAAAAAAVLAWFATIALGRTPRGLRDLVGYAIGYGAQTAGYLLLLTGRYPSSDPALAEPFSHLPEHPVRTVVSDDLERPRLTVVFRLLLAIPHFVWLLLWSVAVVFAALVAWFAALVTGTVPFGLHRFLAAYVRYLLHLFAFIHLVGRRFPGFTGTRRLLRHRPRDRPPAPGRTVGRLRFALFLAFPAVIFGGALGGVLLIVALLAWFYAVVTGRMPEGLRNLGVACLRYGAQLDAYLLL